MRRAFLYLVLLTSLLLLTVPVNARTRPEALKGKDIPFQDRSFCWLWGSGSTVGHIESFPSVFAVSELVADHRLRTAMPTSLIKAVHTRPALSREALTYQVPLWHFETLAESAVTSDRELCAPDPILDIDIYPRPVTQGQTMVLHLKSRLPVKCEITYLDHMVPCYEAVDGTYYALFGVSALASPGEYPLHLSLSSGDRTVSLKTDVQLVTGHYGYQFIDPPLTLSGLLDPELMDEEWDYLKPWRDLRTRERMWTYPLQAPLAPIPSISADYGDRRSYGGMFEGYHSGVDYRASTGTPVISPSAGQVVLTDRLAARGNIILVDHGWGVVTGYWHLSAINVDIGEKVSAGQLLGWVGNTGLSTGSHLHWEFWVNGVAVDGGQWLDGDELLVDLPYPVFHGSGDGLSEPFKPDAY